MKIGSLFDGSGGFPLAGILCEIEPVWASEVEPYPIAVTRSRFRNMKHLGDISKVNGAEVKPVDVITFGSPCQDLSVAGKRAGLKHEGNGDDETTRSGLFMEAVRIIKEMREATNGRYPRFAVWENVPGAFSGNKGEDFRIVLQELIKIAEPNAVMPEVPKKGWAYADTYCGDGWSIAYRVFDAQFWGVPQRRRRIYLVADFRGRCAEKILFERKGLRGYFTESGTQGQTVTPDAERSIGADDREGKGINCLTPWDYQTRRAYGIDGVYPTLTAGAETSGQNQQSVRYGISSYDSNAMKSSNPNSGVYEANTSRTLDNNGGNPSCNQGGIAIVENVPDTLKMRGGCAVDASGKAAGKGALVQENLSATLATSNDQCLFQPVGADIYNLSVTGDKTCALTAGGNASTGTSPKVLVPVATLEPGIAAREGGHIYEGVSGTLRANMGDNQMAVAYDGSGITCPTNASNPQPGDLCHTLSADSRNYVVLAVDQGGGKSSCNVSENISPTLTCTHGGEPAVTYGLDRASFNQGQNAMFDFSILDEITTGSYTQVEEEKSPTLTARDYKDPTCVEFYDTKESRYVVRRLTPTECARLQGFPNKWGHIEPKNELTDDEYHFWLEVRKTHDAINGRAVKDYNEKQMLTWYNKLWTDSAEYKMWGNGIALPCAMYVLQGIKDALFEEQSARSKWLDDLLRG